MAARKFKLIAVLLTLNAFVSPAFGETKPVENCARHPSPSALQNVLSDTRFIETLKTIEANDRIRVENYQRNFLPPKKAKPLRDDLFKLPEKLKATALAANSKLADTAKFVDWLFVMKKKMIERTLARIEQLQAKNQNAKARTLRALLEQGEIDRGIYVQTLIEAAKQKGWRKPRKLPKREENPQALNPTGEFLAYLSNGDLLWDVGQRGSAHGRDAHILQFLYLSETIDPDRLRDLIQWISKNDSTTKSLWDELFDRIEFDQPEIDLHSPESVKELSEIILPFE